MTGPATTPCHTCGGTEHRSVPTQSGRTYCFPCWWDALDRASELDRQEATR